MIYCIVNPQSPKPRFFPNQVQPQLVPRWLGLTLMHHYQNASIQDRQILWTKCIPLRLHIIDPRCSHFFLVLFSRTLTSVKMMSKKIIRGKVLKQLSREQVLFSREKIRSKIKIQVQRMTTQFWHDEKNTHLTKNWKLWSQTKYLLRAPSVKPLVMVWFILTPPSLAADRTDQALLNPSDTVNGSLVL